jgi:hypothetical protein
VVIFSRASKPERVCPSSSPGSAAAPGRTSIATPWRRCPQPKFPLDTTRKMSYRRIASQRRPVVTVPALGWTEGTPHGFLSWSTDLPPQFPAERFAAAVSLSGSRGEAAIPLVRLLGKPFDALVGRGYAYETPHDSERPLGACGRVGGWMAGEAVRAGAIRRGGTARGRSPRGCR